MMTACIRWPQPHFLSITYPVSSAAAEEVAPEVLRRGLWGVAFETGGGRLGEGHASFLNIYKGLLIKLETPRPWTTVGQGRCR